MRPAIVERNGFTLVGMVYRGKNENQEITGLWGEFIPRMSEIGNSVNSDICYGFESYSDDCQETGEFTYLAAVEVDGPGEIPEGMVSQSVPASKYAVFTIPAVVSEIPKAFHDIYTRWLPEAGLVPSGDFDFEYYGEEFIPDNPDSRLQLYIPVK